MKKSSLPKPITILILTLLTALIWVGLSIYRTVTVKPVAEVPENILKPLNPTLNTDVLQKIEASIFIQDSEIPPININVGGTLTPTPIPTAAPEATAIPEASPSASPNP